MYSFAFPTIEPFEMIDFSKPIIWVLNATKTPPHIGISVEQKYFSLKANGKDEFVAVQQLLDLIERKHIPTVFIQLDKQLAVSDLVSNYKYFLKAGENQSTCLTPISQLLHVPNARQLSELLRAIESDIKYVAGLYLPEKYNALPSYSIETIHQHITDLKIYVGE